MKFAIVDIETTGSHASASDITEIAIRIHDGNRLLDHYTTLIYTEKEIPRYIQVLTGITPEMVAKAPRMEEVAPRIAALLKGHVFVAHNVNFDYSFVKHHLEQYGFELEEAKLCTVRLTKKVLPGLPSYSLGNLCRELGLQIKERHRAGGDADATVLLFEHLMRNDALPHIRQFVKKGAKEQSLPPNLAKEEVESLPYVPGVYYFHDQKGKVVYVGKAKNLKYRVRSHFTNNGAGKQKQNFLRTIHKVTYKTCATELMAFLLESVEIKRLWPPYNNSQKKFSATYGVYSYHDRNGYLRLMIDKKKKNIPVHYTFQILSEGHQLLRKLVKQHQLCPRLCFIQTDEGICSGVQEKTCKGACERSEAPFEYNRRVEQAISSLKYILPSFVVLEEGEEPGEQSCILIDRGRFYGMGTIPAGFDVKNLEQLRARLEPYPENEYAKGLVYSYVEQNPEKRVDLLPGSELGV